MADSDITAADQDEFDNAAIPPIPGPGGPKGPKGPKGGKGFIEAAKSGRKIATGKAANPAKKAQFKARMKAMAGRHKNAAATKKATF